MLKTPLTALTADAYMLKVFTDFFAPTSCSAEPMAASTIPLWILRCLLTLCGYSHADALSLHISDAE
jgi:hypothetical protein